MNDFLNPFIDDIPNISLEDFEALVENAFLLKQQIDIEETKLNEKKAELKKIQDKIIYYLNASQKTNYKSASGTIAISKRLSVKVPKNPEARKAFFDYLKEKGIFEDLITVNSQTLNAFYKAEYEKHLETNPNEPFSMAGIGEPVFYEYLSMRRG